MWFMSLTEKLSIKSYFENNSRVTQKWTHVLEHWIRILDQGVALMFALYFRFVASKMFNQLVDYPGCFISV